MSKALTAIPANKPTPAYAVPNACAIPRAPPATTPAAFITAINAGTNEAIAGTNKDMLDNIEPFIILPNTVPVVRMSFARRSIALL